MMDDRHVADLKPIAPMPSQQISPLRQAFGMAVAGLLLVAAAGGLYWVLTKGPVQKENGEALPKDGHSVTLTLNVN